MPQLLLHLLGDYILQSHWMATGKVKHWWPALVHATVYSVFFLVIADWRGVLVIWSTHYLIDRYRLARHVSFAKNLIGSPGLKWRECSVTGYPAETPVWLATWLLIITDNTLHLGINYLAIRCLP